MVNTSAVVRENVNDAFTADGLGERRCTLGEGNKVVLDSCRCGMNEGRCESG